MAKVCALGAYLQMNDPVELALGLAELHWYEAEGVGRYESKIKRYLD